MQDLQHLISAQVREVCVTDSKICMFYRTFPDWFEFSAKKVSKTVLWSLNSHKRNWFILVWTVENFTQHLALRTTLIRKIKMLLLFSSTGLHTLVFGTIAENINEIERREWMKSEKGTDGDNMSQSCKAAQLSEWISFARPAVQNEIKTHNVKHSKFDRYLHKGQCSVITELQSCIIFN